MKGIGKLAVPFDDGSAKTSKSINNYASLKAGKLKK